MMDASGGEQDGRVWTIPAPPAGRQAAEKHEPRAPILPFDGRELPIERAHQYDAADDLFIISTFFNPANFQAKLTNFQIFSASLSSANLNWLVVECAFGGADFVLPASSHVVRVRSEGILWQKERLLNVALSHVPERYEKIAWLDCDLLFERQDWAVQTSALLNDYPVVQCFSHYARLPRGHLAFTGEGEYGESFASLRSRSVERRTEGKYEHHGHTGFAWAARREILSQYGLYDRCVAGGGDHLFAHAFSGEIESECVNGLFGGVASFHRADALEWCGRIHSVVRGEIGCVPGTVLHLWHGDRRHRRYLERQTNLAQTGFDPAKDLWMNDMGCWEWQKPGGKPQKFLEEYFRSRFEDGGD
jgi:hypothetical protein